jgi:hypothetical protein
MADEELRPQGKKKKRFGKPTTDADRYTMPPRLEGAIAVGLVCIFIYSFQFWHTGSVLRIEAVGVLIAGAAIAMGFLLGLIFAIPREASREKVKADGPGTQGVDEADDDHRLKQNSNLVDISDWLTKIVVGVGLVELKRTPAALWKMSVSLSPGLRSPDGTGYANSSAVCCLAIILFFLVAGFLFGYIWTRIYFYSALNDAERSRKADEVALGAEGLRVEGRPRDAVRKADMALNLDAQNARALFTKARALKELAQAKGLPYDKSLLLEALQCVATVVKLLPLNGGPRYNMACYQALLGFDKDEVLNNLRIAVENNPKLKKDALNDRDLESLWDDPKFKEIMDGD